MKTIPLTQGKVALVDDQDYEWLMQWKWHARKQPKARSEYRWYAARTVSRSIKSGSKCIYMHREIAHLIDSDHPENDHRDGNGLNNQRENIRPCTVRQNQHNRIKQSGASSKFKGVYFHKRSGKWHVSITLSNKRLHIGLFQNEEDAAHAYDLYALKFFGEFSKINFPEQSQGCSALPNPGSRPTVNAATLKA